MSAAKPEIPWWWDVLGWKDGVTWAKERTELGPSSRHPSGLTLQAADRGDHPICGAKTVTPWGEATVCLMPPDHWESPHFGPPDPSKAAREYRIVAVSHAKAAS